MLQNLAKNCIKEDLVVQFQSNVSTNGRIACIDEYRYEGLLHLR